MARTVGRVWGGAGRGGGARRPRAPARTGPPPGTGPAELVLLSAATPAHLAATAGRLAARLSDDGGGGPAGPDLAAVAHELRLGRAVLRCRLAVTVRTVAELADALAGFAAHPGPGTGPAGVRSADLRTAAGPPLIEDSRRPAPMWPPCGRAAAWSS